MSKEIGIFFSRELLHDKNLSTSEQNMYALLQNLAKDNKVISTNKKLGSMLGLQENRVSHILSQLKTKGYISIELLKTKNKLAEKRIIELRVFYNTKGGKK